MDLLILRPPNCYPPLPCLCVNNKSTQSLPKPKGKTSAQNPTETELLNLIQSPIAATAMAGSGGEYGKWLKLVASTWIQAFTGTNLDFSAYSTDLKTVLGISQLQLSYLSTASDMGKVFGWCSGLSAERLPLWMVLFLSAIMGMVGYGIQWLLIRQIISLPYFLVFILCLIAGCSISWFNTVCYVLCIRNFPSNRGLALSLSISFNGVSAAIFTLLVDAVNSTDDSLYLLFNAIIPLIASILSLPPILSLQRSPSDDSTNTNCDSFTFILLYVVAILTGLYLIFLNSVSSDKAISRIILAGAILLLVLPIFLPVIVHTSRSCMNFDFFGVDNLDLYKSLVIDHKEEEDNTNMTSTKGGSGWYTRVLGKQQLVVLGEEHSANMLVRRWDFWLYYLAYLCGGTVGLAYSNNLGQIAQSLGFEDYTTSIISIYSTCSFFGRLFSAAPDFLHKRLRLARTGWLAIFIIPTPIAFFLLAASNSWMVLRISTTLLGFSSGFVFAAAVSVTSELFGPQSTGVNHNIVITNIPIGSFVFSLTASLIYDSKAKPMLGDCMVCMGRQCYLETFLWWGCISLVGVASSFLLFLRTKSAYRKLSRT